MNFHNPLSADKDYDLQSRVQSHPPHNSNSSYSKPQLKQYSKMFAFSVDALLKDQHKSLSCEARRGIYSHRRQNGIRPELSKRISIEMYGNSFAQFGTNMDGPRGSKPGTE